MSAPRIGITSHTVVEGDRTLVGADAEYARAVAQAGGLALQVPVLPCRSADDVLGAVDGLVLTGGGDVDPVWYGHEPSVHVGGVDRRRDQWEMELTGRAVAASVPVLGICRGCQVLNVVAGGTLIQHLPEVTSVDHLVLHPRDRISHRLSVRPSSRLSSVVGPEPLAVNTIHHQAVGVLGTGLAVGARADDGIVEAIEGVELPVLGVQWHPENLLGHPRHRRLFDWVVGLAVNRHVRAREVGVLPA